MAERSAALSDNLSAIDTEADVGSISTSRTAPVSRLSSSIHKHCRPTTKEEKTRTRKSYFCKYCPPQDEKGYHTSTQGLQGHLRRHHDIQWSPEENDIRTTARDLGANSLQVLYSTLQEKGEVEGLEGEILKLTIERNTVKQTLLDLVIVRRLPFSLVEWPEFHAFVKALNREATPFIPTHHSTITKWILDHYLESKDTVRKALQSAKTSIHLAVDIWTSPNHSLLLGICGSFVDIQDKYQNILIALRTVHSQSGLDQWEALRPVLIDYGITTKIGAIVGDNSGTNDTLCRTIAEWLSLEHKIPWNAVYQRIRCQGHVINLIVQAFLFSSKKDVSLMESYDKNDEEQREDEDEEEAAATATAATAAIALPARLKGKKRKNEKSGQEQSVDEINQKVRDVMGPMGKLHNIVAHIRKSANRTTWFKNRAGKIIPLDNRTRWNSWFTMLNVALEDKVKAIIQQYIEHYQEVISKDDILDTSDWIQLRTIRDFLQSFYDATLFLQGDRTTLERVLESIDILQDIIQTAVVYYIVFLTIL
jgi:hypothetical protein